MRGYAEESQLNVVNGQRLKPASKVCLSGEGVRTGFGQVPIGNVELANDRAKYAA